MSEPMRIFAARLKTAREFRQMSQKALAKRAVVHAPSLSLFEGGHRLPSCETLKALCTALKVSADYLLGISDTMAINRLSDDVKAKYSRISRVEHATSEFLTDLKHILEDKRNK